VQVAAAVAYLAMVVAADLAVAVAVAPEEMVGVELVMEVAAVVAPSSMVETVLTSQAAVAHTSVVAVAASQIMAMAPLAPAEEEVEEGNPVAA
jgi:hypothetical protein